MTTTSLERLFIDVCTDANELKRVQEDPVAAYREAGASEYVISCLQRERGSWLSMALTMTRPVPSQEDIDELVSRMVREDAFFADRLRVEPRRVLERAMGVRFPVTATFEVIEEAGYPVVAVAGLIPAAGGNVGVTPYADADVDVDVDVDVDSDVDIDTVVDTVVDTVTDTSSLVDGRARAVIGAQWESFWNAHSAYWRSRDDRVNTDA